MAGDPPTAGQPSHGVPNRSGQKRNQTTLFTFTVTLSVVYDQPVTMSFRPVQPLRPRLRFQVAIGDILQWRNAATRGFEQTPDVGVDVPIAAVHLRQQPQLRV